MCFHSGSLAVEPVEASLESADGRPVLTTVRGVYRLAPSGDQADLPRVVGEVYFSRADWDHVELAKDGATARLLVSARIGEFGLEVRWLERLPYPSGPVVLFESGLVGAAGRAEGRRRELAGAKME
jgi:hypothetical protein